MRPTTIIAVIALLLTGCASFRGPDYEQLRRAEQAGAKISDYYLATDPAGDDVTIVTDVSDTTMAPTGTTKKLRLRDMPVSDPAQSALDAKQDAVAAASDAEIIAGTETAPRLISPAQAKLAVETHGGAMAYPFIKERTISDPADADDFFWFRAPADLTLASFNCIAEGTSPSITVDLQECDSAGANCASVLAAAVTADGGNDAGTISDTAVASGAWMRALLGAPSGTVTAVSFTLAGTQ